MGYLRDKLKEKDPNLFQLFLRSWEIALNEWMPAIKSQMDSFNSYPHIRNIENHLDALFLNIENRDEDTPLKRISSIELYILLSAILFHDIGRCVVEKNHAEESKKIVHNKWAELGIASYELAKIIGNICHFHDTKEEIPLYPTTLDKYGEIRVRKLAILLKLGDRLDSAYTRVMPHYLKPHSTFEPIGAFRKLINGVYVDIDANMVKTVIGGGEEVKSQHKFKEIKIEFRKNREEYKKFIKILKKPCSTAMEEEYFSFLNFDKLDETISEKYKKNNLELLKDLSGYVDIQKVTNNNDKKNKIHKKITELSLEETNLFNLLRQKNIFKIDELMKVNEIKIIIDYFYRANAIFKSALMSKYAGETANYDIPLLFNQIVQVESKDDNKNYPDFDHWPQDVILSIIISDVMQNAFALKDIGRELESAGLPLKAWLIEFNERLYNISWQETFEPIFDKNYLINIAECMWKLSTQIFGTSMFSYRELSAEARDPDIRKVKMAVKRLSIIAAGASEELNQEPENSKKNRPKNPIWYSSANWLWEVETTQNSGCKFLSFCELKDRIDDDKIIGDPVYGK